MGAPWENYASQASEAGPWAKYSQSQDPSFLGDFVKGAASKLNPLEMIKGMGETAKQFGDNPIDTALSVLAHPYYALKRAKEALDAGKPEEAAAHVQAAITPGGFATEASQVKTATPGKRAEGLGELVGTGLASLLTAKAPDIVQSAAQPIKQAAGSAADTALAPGTREVVGIFSPRAKHVLDIAARTRDAVQKAAEAPKVEPPPLPVVSPAVAQDTAVLDDIAKGLGGKSYSKLGQAGQETVRMIADKMKAQETAQSGPKIELKPTEGTVEEKVIPFSKESPGSEFFKAKARADRAPKVELLSRHLSESGITADQIDQIPPAKLRELASALKIELPDSLDSTLRDIKTRVGELQSSKTTFKPSSELENALKKPGALEAARKLAEAMQ